MSERKLETSCECPQRFPVTLNSFFILFDGKGEKKPLKETGNKLVSNFEKGTNGNKSGDVLKTLKYYTESYSTA